MNCKDKIKSYFEGLGISGEKLPTKARAQRAGKQVTLESSLAVRDLTRPDTMRRSARFQTLMSLHATVEASARQET